MDQEFPVEVLPHIVQPLQKQNPLRPFTFQRALSNDILFDLDPTRTLEALTSSSGSLSTIIEDVTPSERAFGIRAVIACKSIQEWLEELTNWAWEKKEGLTGFEISSTNKGRLSTSHETLDEASSSKFDPNLNYIGCLTELQISVYESRLNQIYDAMNDLRVDEIKRQVLDTHFSSKSRPSSSYSSVPFSKFLSSESYSRIDDFTAIITASILQALPKLSKLVRLMEVWRVRICVLRKIPAFLVALEDTEIALKSGWNAIKNKENGIGFKIDAEPQALSRETFDVIRYILQEKVMALGQRLDFMLNMLEGSQDTIPESWLARMEDIEEDYGEWVVAGERQVRRSEWLTDAELGSVEKNEMIEMRKILNSISGQEALRTIEQPQLYTTEVADSENITELRAPAATPKSLEQPAESNISPINTKREVLESYSATDMNAIEIDVGKRLQEGYDETSKKLSSLEKRNLLLNNSTFTVEKNSKDVTGSKEGLISESLMNTSYVKTFSAAPDKNNHCYEQSEIVKLNSSGRKSSSTLASSQSETDVDCENIIKTFPQDITIIEDSPTRDSNFSSPHKAFFSKDKKSNVTYKPVAEEASKDKHLNLNGSSECFEKLISNLSEIDELQNLSHASNHDINEICSLVRNADDNVTNHSIFESSNYHRRSFLDGIEDIDFCDVKERNENKPVSRSTINSKILTKNHQSPDDSFEFISSTEPIMTHLNSQASNDCPMDSKFTNVIEPYVISNKSCVRLPVFCTDSSSESCFTTSDRSKNRDNKNSAGTRLSSKLYRRKRSTSLPSEVLSSKDPSEDNSKASKVPISHSSHPSLELRKHTESYNTINIIPSSADIILLDEAGLEYTLKISFDGKITYTNKNLIISTISSSIDISALCIVTLEGCVPSLSLVSSGTYSVIPPQPIFSIYYRGLAPNVIRNNHPKLDFNSVLENYRPKNISNAGKFEING